MTIPSVAGSLGSRAYFAAGGPADGSNHENLALCNFRSGAGRGDLCLQRGELVLDARLVADRVEFLLDVVTATAHVLKNAGLQQLIQRTRPGLHVGDLVLR